MFSICRSTEVYSMPADYIGQFGLGYTIAILASDELAQAVQSSLEILNAKLPGVIWPMPNGALHITLCELVGCRPYMQNKEVLALSQLPIWRKSAKQVFSGISPFLLHFSTLEASQQAIIARSEDTEIFNILRQQLLMCIKLPTETKRPPPLVHSTIARYLSAVALSQIQRSLHPRSLDHTELVNEFVLLKTTIRPFLDYEIVERFPLHY